MIFNPTEILLPANKDYKKWAVIACDQYSAERAYWNEIEASVGDSSSTLRLTLPEVYLRDADVREREDAIGKTAAKYLQEGVFKAFPNAFVLVERTLRGGAVRRGIVGALDLESFIGESVGLDSYCGKCRSTERLVPSRLPPRARIREASPLETSHVMLLINDPEKQIIKQISTEGLQVLYDFELLGDSGRVRGYLLDGARAASVAAQLNNLPDGVLVGDGNHSIAAARLLWNDTKKTLSPEARANHPARFMLAELNNVFDDSIVFHPINRVVFDVGVDDWIAGLRTAIEGDGSDEIECRFQGRSVKFKAKPEKLGDIIETIQDYIDECRCDVDYIHSETSFETLSEPSGNVSIRLPLMNRSELFAMIDERGVLPRKSFSIGEAYDKRFYLECKKIVNLEDFDYDCIRM